MLQDLFRSIDAKDSARFVRFLTPDATFRFGNAPAIAGHAAIEQAVAGFFASLKALA